MEHAAQCNGGIFEGKQIAGAMSRRITKWHREITLRFAKLLIVCNCHLFHTVNRYDDLLHGPSLTEAVVDVLRNSNSVELVTLATFVTTAMASK